MLFSSSLLVLMIVDGYSTAQKHKTVLRQIFYSFSSDKYEVCLPICNLLVSSVFLFLLFYLFEKNGSKFALWILEDQTSNMFGLLL